MRARDNPFAVGRFDRLRYRFPPGDSMESLLARLREHGMRGALVGPEGRGKSTLLDELGERLSEEGFRIGRFTLRHGESRLPREIVDWLSAAGDREALLLDGAEQLSFISWLRLRLRTRRLGAFVITSHRDGLLPTVHRCETTTHLLLELLDELAPDRPPEFPSAETLWHRHDGDLRQAMFEAYDFWAGSGADDSSDGR
jgi:hypothetical protein